MNKKKTTGSPGIPIQCEQTGEVFRSIYQAAHAHGILHGNLYRHVNGDPRYTHVAGYTFTRDIQLSNFKKKPMRKKTQGERGGPRGKTRRIQCDQTGEKFSSIAHAARTLNIFPSSISRHVNGDKSYTHVGGYTFTVL